MSKPTWYALLRPGGMQEGGVNLSQLCLPAFFIQWWFWLSRWGRFVCVCCCAYWGSIHLVSSSLLTSNVGTGWCVLETRSVFWSVPFTQILTVCLPELAGVVLIELGDWRIEKKYRICCGLGSHGSYESVSNYISSAQFSTLIGISHKHKQQARTKFLA